MKFLVQSVKCLVLYAVAMALWAQGPEVRPDAGATAAKQAPSDPKMARVEGRVVTSTGEPVVGAKVAVGAVLEGLEDWLPPEKQAVVSDDDGRFVIENVAPTPRLGVWARKAGYAEEQSGAKMELLPLAEGETARGLTLTLDRQGVLKGRVLDAFGDPVNRAEVVLMNVSYWGGVRHLEMAEVGGVVTETKTNDLGEYRIAGLPPGRYFLHAHKRDVEYGEGVVALPAYFPQALDEGSAQPIMIQPGDDRTADIHLGRAKGYAVRGILEGARMDWTEEMRPYVNAVPTGRGSPEGAPVGNDGRFEIRLLTPGNYRLRVSSRVVDFSAGTLTVIDQEVDGLVLRAPREVAVMGRVTMSLEGQWDEVAAAAARSADKPFFFRENEPNSVGLRLVDTDRGFEEGTAVNADGTFTMERVRPGRFRVNVVNAPGTYVKAVLLGDAEITEKAIEIEGNAVLQVTLGKNPPMVSGVVMQDGTPQAGKMVALWPEKALGLFRDDGNDTAVTDRTGGFHFRGVRPGVYYAVALEGVDRYTALVRPLLDQFKDVAVKVEVTEGVDVTVEPVLIPAVRVREALEKLP